MLESRMWMMFTAAELDFLRSQRIGRFATVGPSGWPHVVPVMYTMNDDGSLDFEVDGVSLRHLPAAPRAAMVVDVLAPKTGAAIPGRVDPTAADRARLKPVRAFTWAALFEGPP